MTKRAVPIIEPIGLNREEGATYIGVSPTLFDEMVSDERMPEPRVANSRMIWDREELRSAFKALPKRDRKPTRPKVDWSKAG